MDHSDDINLPRPLEMQLRLLPAAGSGSPKAGPHSAAAPHRTAGVHAAVTTPILRPQEGQLRIGPDRTGSVRPQVENHCRTRRWLSGLVNSNKFRLHPSPLEQIAIRSGRSCCQIVTSPCQRQRDHPWLGSVGKED